LVAARLARGVQAWRTSSGPALAGLVALVVALFSGVIFGGRVFYDRDIHLEWYSQIEGFVRSVATGAWPVWDDTIAFGQPLLADPSAQIAYPPTWLNLLVQPWDYYRIFVVGHCLFTAVGMLRLARHLKSSSLAAFAAAGVWTVCGPLLSLVNVWHHFAGACWIPWVVLAALCAVSSPGLAAALFWGAAQGMQILAGSADMAALGVVASGILIGGRIDWRAPPGRAVLNAGGRVLVAGAVAAALSAVLWMPTLEVLLRSARAALPEAQRSKWSVPLLGFARTLLPVIPVDLPWSDSWAARLFDSVPPFLPSLYLGLPTLVLVVVSRKSPDRGLWRATAIVFVGALAVALGRHAPFYGLAVRLLPPLAIFRYPSKVMLLAAFAWALLVAFGVDAAKGAPERRTRRLWGALGLAGAMVATLGVWLLVRPEAVASMLHPPPWTQPLALLSWPLASGLVRAGVCLVLAAGLLVGGRGRWRRLGVVGAVGVCLVDLVGAHRSLNLTTSRELVTFRPPILEGLTNRDHQRLYTYEYFLTPGSSQRYLGRDDPYVIANRPGQTLTPELKVLSQRLYPFPPVAGRWGLEGSFDVDTRGLYPKEVSTLIALLHSVEGTPAHSRLLRLGAVSRVIALHTRGFEDLVLEKTLPSLFPEPVRRFAVPDPLPRTYVVGAARDAEGLRALGVLLDPSFDSAREVVLSTSAANPPASEFHGASRILELVSDRVRIEAELSAPGYIVLVDAYDPGWKATLDGLPVPLLRANLAFRAVRASAGRHVVQFKYRPTWMVRGLGISLVTALALLVIGLLAMRRGDQRGGKTSPSTGAPRSGPGDGTGDRPDDGPAPTVPRSGRLT